MPERRAQARHATGRGLAQRRACWLLGVARSALAYEPVRPGRDAELTVQLRGIALCYLDWGYWLAWGLLRYRGSRVNHKRVHRLWRCLKLQQPLRPPRRKLKTGSRLDPHAHVRNQVWCYDFVHDRDAHGRPFRCLSVKDEATAYALAIEVAWSFNGTDVQQLIERLAQRYGYPAYLRSDNRGEFIAGHLRAWLAGERVRTAYIEAGKPWQNGPVESFHSTLRRGCLNRHGFTSLEEAKIIIEAWRRTYNEVRPHSRLGYRPPASAYFLEREMAA